MNNHEFIGPKIKSINNQIKQTLCKEGQEMNLTSAQMHVLRYLCLNQDSVIYQKDILNEFELSNATVSGIISRLEAKGFVTCTLSDFDSRCKQIKVTEKALGYHLFIRENIKQLEMQIVDGFTEDEIHTLHNFLNRMIKNLNS